MKRIRKHTGRGAALGTALLLLPLFGAGCLQSETESESPVALAANAAAGESWVEAWDTTGPPPVPTAAELQSALGLDAEQMAVVEGAIAELGREREARMATVRERVRGGGRGPGGHGVPAGFGEFESPLLGFLETVVPVLDTPQIEKLADLFPSRAAAAGPRGARGPRDGSGLEGGRGARDGSGRGDGSPGRRGGHGPGGGPGLFLGQLLRDLDLTAEQRTELRATMDESRTAFHELRRAFREDEITAEQLRDDAKELRESLESDLESALTAEQLATLEEALAEHRAAVAQRRLDNLESGMARRAEFLTNVLELSDAQSAQVESILNATLSERRTLLESLAAGTIEIEDALYQGYVLAEQTAASVRAVLTAEQAAVFDALKELLPGHRGPKGP